MKPIRDLDITAEDLQAAIFGFGVAKQEIERREERFRYMLEQFPRGQTNGNGHGHVTTPLPQQQIAKGENGEVKQIYHSDGQPVYRTNTDGTVMIGKRGFPLKAQHWTAEKRASVAQRYAKGSPLGEKLRAGKLKARGEKPATPEAIPGRKVKMEYWADGSPKFLTNADGSVRLTAKGEPWKRMRSDKARELAHLSHVARGLTSAEGGTA